MAQHEILKFMYEKYNEDRNKYYSAQEVSQALKCREHNISRQLKKLNLLGWLQLKQRIEKKTKLVFIQTYRMTPGHKKNVERALNYEI